MDATHTCVHHCRCQALLPALAPATACSWTTVCGIKLVLNGRWKDSEGRSSMWRTVRTSFQSESKEPKKRSETLTGTLCAQLGFIFIFNVSSLCCSFIFAVQLLYCTTMKVTHQLPATGTLIWATLLCSSFKTNYRDFCFFCNVDYKLQFVSSWTFFYCCFIRLNALISDCRKFTFSQGTCTPEDLKSSSVHMCVWD